MCNVYVVCVGEGPLLSVYTKERCDVVYCVSTQDVIYAIKVYAYVIPPFLEMCSSLNVLREPQYHVVTCCT